MLKEDQNNKRCLTALVINIRIFDFVDWVVREVFFKGCGHRFHQKRAAKAQRRATLFAYTTQQK
jgi:hypothetical protein